MRSTRAGEPRWIAGSMASLRPSPRSHARRSRSLHTRARSDWTWRKANPAMMTSEEIQIAPRRRMTSFTGGIPRVHSSMPGPHLRVLIHQKPGGAPTALIFDLQYGELSREDERRPHQNGLAGGAYSIGQEGSAGS